MGSLSLRQPDWRRGGVLSFRGGGLSSRKRKERDAEVESRVAHATQRNVMLLPIYEGKGNDRTDIRRVLRYRLLRSRDAMMMATHAQRNSPSDPQS
jgi:hypothetical protein